MEYFFIFESVVVVGLCWSVVIGGKVVLVDFVGCVVVIEDFWFFEEVGCVV